MEGAIARSTGLPAFETGEVKLSVSGIEPAAHDPGVKLQRKPNHPTLDLAIDLFHQHVKERALAIGGVKEMARKRPPPATRHPDLPPGGIIHREGEPAQWLVVIRRRRRSMIH